MGVSHRSVPSGRVRLVGPTVDNQRSHTGSYTGGSKRQMLGLEGSIVLWRRAPSSLDRVEYPEKFR